MDMKDYTWANLDDFSVDSETIEIVNRFTEITPDGLRPGEILPSADDESPGNDDMIESELVGEVGSEVQEHNAVGANEEKNVDQQDDDDEEEDFDEFDFSPLTLEEEGTVPTDDQDSAALSGTFDMNLLRSCIESGKVVLDKIQDKDVVLVVGKTGAGKSLFLQGVAGKKIVAIEHQLVHAGRTVTTIVFDAESPLPGFEVGHDKVSQTKSINCLIRHGVGKRKEDIIYIDSPGWEDTSGCEIDIATSIMIGQVVKKARSLRLVVVINFASLLENKGDPMREVLKLAHTFVSDFEKDKMSFMFLFTHTNELSAETSSSLDAERSCVEKEIYKIRHGTLRDSEVQCFLDFMMLCFQRKYKFVDVLHPLHTNFEEVARFVETKLRPIRQPPAASNFGLTVKSHLKLQGQLQMLLSSLRRLFQQAKTGQNMETFAKELKEVRSTLGYFHLSLSIQGAQEAFNECQYLCEDYVAKHRLAIDEELKKATDENENFGPENVDAMKASIQQIEAVLQPNQDEDSVSLWFVEIIFSKVFEASYARATSDSALHDLEQTLKELGKLKAWSEGFGYFKHRYLDACHLIENQIQIVTDQLATMDGERLAELPAESIPGHVYQLIVLEMVHQASKTFSLHNINVGDTSKHATSIAKEPLLALAENWEASCDKDLNNVTSTERSPSEYLLLIAGRAKKLETWCAQLSLRKSYHDVVAAIDVCLRKMVDCAVSNFEYFCSNSGAIPQGHSGDMEEKFKHLHNIHSSFEGLPVARWQKVLQVFNEFLRDAESKLEVMMIETRAVANQCSQYGLREGEKHAENLCIFESYIWFDNYSHATIGSVETCFRNTIDVYWSRLNHIAEAGEKSSSALKFLSLENTDLLRQCDDLAAEIEQFKILEKQIGGGSKMVIDMQTEAFAGLEAYTGALCERTVGLCSDWLESFQNKEIERARELTEQLNILLKELESMNSVHFLESLKAESQRAREQIKRFFKSAEDHVKEEFGTSSRYKEKADHLKWISAVTGFTYTDLFVPNGKEYKEKGRDIVRAAAVEMKRLINTSSNRDTIDDAFRSFQDAKILDPNTYEQEIEHFGLSQSLQRVNVINGFADGQPQDKSTEENQEEHRNVYEDFMSSMGLSIKDLVDGDAEGHSPYVGNENPEVWQLIQEQKKIEEDEADQSMREMIHDGDFASMGHILDPLSSSNDPRKKWKHFCYIRKIAASLRGRIQETRANLRHALSEEDIQYFAETMRMLRSANEEIGNHIENHLNLLQEMAKLNGKASDKLEVLADLVVDASNQRDFLKMGRNFYLASILSCDAESWLCPRAVQKFNDAKSTWEAAKDSVPTLVDEFIRSSFAYCGTLLRIVRSLKDASKSQYGESSGLEELYAKTVAYLSRNLQAYLQHTCDVVNETGAYDDGILVIENLLKREAMELQMHIDPPSQDYKTLVHGWQEEKKKLYYFSISNQSQDEVLQEFKTRMDKLKSAFAESRFPWDTQLTYKNLQHHSETKVLQDFERCQRLMDKGEILSSRQSFKRAIHWTKVLEDHIPEQSNKKTEVQSQVVTQFIQECNRAAQLLSSNNMVSFESYFPDIRLYAIHFPFILDNPEAKKEFCLVNQLVHDALRDGITNLHEAISDHDFKRVRKFVERNRTHGAFMADSYSLLFEELKQRGKCQNDEWLERIWDITCNSFSCGRDLTNIKSFAILGVVPSATEDDIQQSFEEKSRQVHPDSKKSNSLDCEEDNFQRLKHAHDRLLASRHARTEPTTERLFDSTLRDIPSDLGKFVRECVQTQQYDGLGRFLVQLPDFEAVCKLVDPPMDYEEIKDGITQHVRDYVSGIRMHVSTSWNERKYNILNQSITDLKQMEKHLKSFPAVFPESWSREIVDKVETEIKSLGREARSFLQDRRIAIEHVDDFRRCLINMGAVLVELQMFNDFTRNVMYDVLESCLHSEWGHSYLFELGLKLHRDKSGGEDEVRIGRTILSEFSHFKEVMTLAWNEETVQKRVEETVKSIVGEKRNPNGGPPDTVDIDRDSLLSSFHLFEHEYNALLVDYLPSDSDKGELADKTIQLAKNLQPLSCDDGWNERIKDQVPKILAGVFSLFTIVKSGDSFNRIQETSGTGAVRDKILIKPHNIQVLTVLYLLGCGKIHSSELQSQLMQIRTGEGKSMVLGATAAVLGLLGFQVRCVCYSDYLSSRDYSLFEHVFSRLGLDGLVTYSKITTFSEDTARMKGDLRGLTQSVLQQKLSKPPRRSTEQQNLILLVDEVDVFFSKEFYGQTHNQVAEVRTPEIAQILTDIWEAYQQNSRMLRLSRIQNTTAYQTLIDDMPQFKSLIDNEIRSMLDHVQRVDEEPYFLHPEHDQIGYKVLDTISYQVTYGYRTIFAYLKEASNGNLRDKDATLARVLAMQVSCGQFSYANVKPQRILGVTGTLSAMGTHEKNVLLQYGVENYMFVPSVYGQSNFVFDKAGEGIYFESDESDYFQRICEEILSRIREKRAVIVFFKNNRILDKFRKLYIQRLGRQTTVLREDMDPSEKDFVISKAASAGQITLCPAVFGRGTDFFCKDDTVQQGGGVHIIQTFLSAETSEEVQIQGRTSRQGKKGSYQLVLLEKDLCEDFGVAVGEKDNIPRNKRYEWLSEIREQEKDKYWKTVEDNLMGASSRDEATHKYFDSLLEGNQSKATRLLEDLYWMIKKPPIPESITIDIAFLIDVTGSMSPYREHLVSTIQGLVDGDNSIVSVLVPSFPDTQLKLRAGVLGYRDIDDGANQFNESLWDGGGHFTETMSDVISFVDQVTAQPSGGGDMAEDHLGAIHHCVNWCGPLDWSSTIKMVLLFTDAPAHGFVHPTSSLPVSSFDEYATRHPKGLTPYYVSGGLVSNGTNLFMCSYNPGVTSWTEEKLSFEYLSHHENSRERSISRISMVPQDSHTAGYYPQHTVFVLDESGSMSRDWPGVVHSYNEYISKRIENQNESDLVSVVQFGGNARVTIQTESIRSASRNLGFRKMWTTRFGPAATSASEVVESTPTTHRPTVVFMSDGETNDSARAASTFAELNQRVKATYGCDLKLHVVAFRDGADTRQLQEIASSSPNGHIHVSSDITSLTNVFVDIAVGQQNVVTALQGGIVKEISEAVNETLCLEYLP